MNSKMKKKKNKKELDPDAEMQNVISANISIHNMSGNPSVSMNNDDNEI